MAQRNSEYERIPNEFFATPHWVTASLLRARRFHRYVMEPASGEGHMVRSLEAHNYRVKAFDITNGQDFFDVIDPMGCHAIITNPPHSRGRSDVFVEHALELMERVSGQVAMLLPLAWDTAHGRRHLFLNNKAFSCKYQLTRRIRWQNLEQKKAGPSMNFAWFVWDFRDARPPRVGYLPLSDAFNPNEEPKSD